MDTSTSVSEQTPRSYPEIPEHYVFQVRHLLVGSMPAFIAVHIGALVGLIWFMTWPALVLALILYALRMFAVTAGYHRYFSHRTFKTSRFLQFVLALLAVSSAQRGVLAWAARHRLHHRMSDRPGDIHSPVQSGFLYAHVLWLCDARTEPDLARVRDMAGFPELQWLERWPALPPTLLGAACFFAMGWPGLLVGFMLSTVVLWHATFMINSLAHVWGSRRYDTPDQSRNNPLLALLALGEGWHNNHHHYAWCARQGFRWWEIDVTYYVLRLLAALGLVWDIKEPPADRIRVGMATDASSRI